MELDAIVTLVDAKHLLLHLDDTSRAEGVENEALEQIAFADKVIVNKVDLVSEAELNEIERRIRSINAVADIKWSEFGKVDLDSILNVHAFDLDRVMDLDPTFLTESEHQHDQTVTSVGLDVIGRTGRGPAQPVARHVPAREGCRHLSDEGDPGPGRIGPAVRLPGRPHASGQPACLVAA